MEHAVLSFRTRFSFSGEKSEKRQLCLCLSLRLAVRKRFLTCVRNDIVFILHRKFCCYRIVTGYEEIKTFFYNDIHCIFFISISPLLLKHKLKQDLFVIFYHTDIFFDSFPVFCYYLIQLAPAKNQLTRKCLKGV